MNAAIRLAELSALWQSAKADEEAARERRVEIESQIVAALPSAEHEGSARADAGGYRVSVEYRVTRKVDSDALSAAWSELTPNQRDAFRWKADVNLRQLRAMQQLAPKEFAVIAKLIETKPAKPSVSVTPLES
jgi:hypothetical protein